MNLTSRVFSGSFITVVAQGGGPLETIQLLSNNSATVVAVNHAVNLQTEVSVFCGVYSHHHCGDICVARAGLS